MQNSMEIMLLPSIMVWFHDLAAQNGFEFSWDNLKNNRNFLLVALWYRDYDRDRNY